MVIFFFASAAASSAYLTAREIFPLEVRALAIACFYAIGTAFGGVVAPWLFTKLLASGKSWAVAGGYAGAALLLVFAALTEWKWGVDSEQKSLEKIAAPLSHSS
jgi:MFS family permease